MKADFGGNYLINIDTILHSITIYFTACITRIASISIITSIINITCINKLQ